MQQLPARNSFVLFGWHLSYYAGKVRCYLHYKQIPFDDRPVDFWTLTHDIKSRFGAPVMPVVVTPSGEWLQDSSAIIDRLEAAFPQRPVIPTSPVQRFAAYLLETWGDEWWIPIAMHTRWSYAENFPLFEREAGRALLPRFPRFLQRLAVARVSRQLRGYLPVVGIVAAQLPILDAWTARMLDDLDRHFAAHPYLIGGTPTIADFGLIGSMYGHLGRDPWPKRELIAPRPHLRAWIDRMAEPPQSDGVALSADDSLPSTLSSIFDCVAREFLPMTEAILAKVSGATTDKGQTLPRGLGPIRHPMGDAMFERGAMTFTLWKMQRLLDLHAAMRPEEQAAVRAWLTGIGAERLLAMDIPRLRREGLLVTMDEARS